MTCKRLVQRFFIDDIAAHIIIQPPAGKDHLRMIAHLLCLMGEIIGIHPDTMAAYKTRTPLLLLQPPRPRGAANRGFGVLLAPLMDHLVQVRQNDGEKRKSRAGLG